MPFLERNSHRHCRKNGSRRKQPEPGLERPGQILQEPQAEREEKSTEAARGPHEAGSHPHLLGKSGRDDLKDRPVAESHCAYANNRVGHGVRKRRQGSYQPCTQCDPDKNQPEHHQTTDTIGKKSADRTDQASDQPAKRRNRSGSHQVHPVLIMEENGKKAAESYKAAERHSIKKAQPIQRTLFEGRNSCVPPVMLALLARNSTVRLHQKDEEEERQSKRKEHESEYAVPADNLPQSRGEQHSQDGAAVTGSRDPHRQSLVRGRIGIARDRQRDRKTSTGHPEE